MRAQIAAFVEQPAFSRTVTALIIVNALVLGLETVPEANAAMGPWLRSIDFVILWIFVGELALRLIAYGPRFFRDPWSCFDFLVVAISLSSLSGLSALRAFRVFRVLRMLNAFPPLRKVVTALLSAIPGVASVGVILAIILFVASVIATKLFGPQVPLFADLFTSMLTLFKVMTLEGWPDIADETLAVYPYAWIFFVVYILVATLTMLNLFVAIIVSAMESEAVTDMATHETQEEILAELRALRAKVDDLER